MPYTPYRKRKQTKKHLKHVLWTILFMSFPILNGCATQSNNAAANATTSYEDTSRLLPEAAPIMLDFKVPELEDLKQNVYAGMLAIYAPEGMDYMAIGAQAIHNDAKFVQTALKTFTEIESESYNNTQKHFDNQTPLKTDLTTGKDNYFYYACIKLNAKNCITKTLEKKEQIQEIMSRTDNAIIMQRYLNIRQLPQYKAYVYPSFSIVPAYEVYTRLSALRLSQAIWTIHEGDIDKGFEILAEEMAFAKRVLREDNSLIGTMISISMLFNNYHTLSALIGTPQMKPYLHDPRLLALLEPLTEQEQKALTNTFETERNYALYLLYTLNENTAKTDADKDDHPFLNLLSETNFKVNYDRYASVNTAYKAWEAMIQRANLSMDEIAELYTQNKLETLEELQQKAYEKHAAVEEGLRKNNPNIPGNTFGRTIIEFSFPIWEDYFDRFYDVQSYILLVNAKHQILSKNLKADEIDAFLKQAGETAQNPITREPFTWNAEEGTLSTPWLAKYPPPGGRGNQDGPMLRNAVYIPFEKD